MIRNRLVALIYRCVSVCVIFAGLFVGSGLVPWPKSLLFYTTQSNIAVLAYFVYLSVRTAIDLAKKGQRGCACYLPRLSTALLMFISFTFLIFWSVLAPFLSHSQLWTFGNLTVHGISPLLMLVGHILFCRRGLTKKHDTFLFALIPLAYVILSCALGFCKVIFYYTDACPHYFPYPFMDFYELGMLALIPIIMVASAYMLLTHLVIRLDRKKRAKKSLE